MLGFFTLISLILALFVPSWWSWAGFGFLFLAWLGKRNRGKKNKDAISKERISGNWPDDLLEACTPLTRYSDCYVGDLIPEKKLTAAAANYPPPGDGKILALIDTTFGSASKGLAVGRDGVAWKNGSETAVQIGWSRLAKSKISSSDDKVSVGSAKFSTSGALIKLPDAEAFFIRLRDYARTVTPIDQSETLEQKRERPTPVKTTTQAPPLVAVNSAGFEELLALPGIEAAEARLIIKLRAEQPFRSNDDLVDRLDLKPHFASKLDGTIDYGRSLPPLPQKIEAPQQTVSSAPKLGRKID